MFINYITTMENATKIINNQINQLENDKLFKELEQKIEELKMIGDII